jgi:hypothetical protein
MVDDMPPEQVKYMTDKIPMKVILFVLFVVVVVVVVLLFACLFVCLLASSSSSSSFLFIDRYVISLANRKIGRVGVVGYIYCLQGSQLHYSIRLGCYRRTCE